MSTPTEIRVLIADDSAVSRKVLSDLIKDEPDISVVGSVADGQAAVDSATTLRPNIILMDVMMPQMDGLSATRTLMHDAPCPILVISELVGREADLNFRALEAGALDLMRKPSREELADGAARTQLLRKIRTYVNVPVVRRHRRRARVSAEAIAPPPRRTARAPIRDSLICIGASTGGPPAVRQLLGAFTPQMRAPVVVVQHMTEGFIGGMASWLDNQLVERRVQVAREGQVLEENHVYLAPDNAHLTLRDGRLRCQRELPDASHRPSVSAMFHSLALSDLAASSVGVLLTGMGNDGASGLLAMRQAGAFTIAQDEGTSTVYGMPRAAAELGAAIEVLALEDIAPRIHAYQFGAVSEMSA